MAPRILVTGTSTFFATRLIHELGQQGAEITAADSLLVSPGKVSKFASRRLRLPTLATEPGKYLAAIRDELRTRQYDLLLPTFEEGLLFAEYQEELRELTNLFLPFETMVRLHHKPTLHEVCQELSIPSPATIVVADEQDLRQHAGDLLFPVVLKLPAGNNSVGRTYCDDWESLRDNFRQQSALQMALGAEPPFIQQKIDGELIYTLCFCNAGQMLGEVIYRANRTFPEKGGTAAQRETIHHAEISRLSSKLCAANNWTGFLGPDFIVDRQTRIPYLIDANVRSNPAVHLGYRAGINWSQFLLDILAGKEPTPAVAKVGVNSHTLLLDGGCLLEILLPRGDGIRALAGRIDNLIRTKWHVDSQDDLLGIGEYQALAALLGHGAYSLLKAALTGRQVGHVLLDNANYDPVTAEQYRRTRAVRHSLALAAASPQAPLRRAA